MIRLDDYLAQRWPGREADVETITVRNNISRTGWYIQDDSKGLDDPLRQLGWLNEGERPVFDNGFTFIRAREETPGAS